MFSSFVCLYFFSGLLCVLFWFRLVFVYFCLLVCFMPLNQMRFVYNLEQIFNIGQQLLHNGKYKSTTGQHLLGIVMTFDLYIIVFIVFIVFCLFLHYQNAHTPKAYQITTDMET